MKLRIKTDHNIFEGRYFVVQKRCAFLFWRDISGWLYSLDGAQVEMKAIYELDKIGVKV